MSADLREAATQLRRLVEAATPGPWQPFYTIHADPFVVPVAFPHLSRRIADVSVSPEDYGRGNCELIGALGPILAAAVADLLDAIAEQHGSHLYPSQDCPESRCQRARAVAAAVLGEPG